MLDVSDGWRPVWGTDLEPGHCCTAIQPVKLRNSSNGAMVPLLAVGTVAPLGEDYPCLGYGCFFLQGIVLCHQCSCRWLFVGVCSARFCGGVVFALQMLPGAAAALRSKGAGCNACIPPVACLVRCVQLAMPASCRYCRMLPCQPHGHHGDIVIVACRFVHLSVVLLQLLHGNKRRASPLWCIAGCAARSCCCSCCCNVPGSTQLLVCACLMRRWLRRSLLLLQLSREAKALPGGLVEERWTGRKAYEKEFSGPIVAIAEMKGYLLLGGSQWGVVALVNTL